MCNPLLAVAAIAAVGGGLQANSQIQQGKATEKISEINAGIANRQAEDTRKAGAIQEARVQQQVRAQIARQRVAMAANGVDLGSGTALDLTSETAGIGAQDTTMARSNALREAWGFNAQATDLLNQGRAARKASLGQAAGTLLSSGSQAYGMYK